MTKDERKLLEMCRPRVVLQGSRTVFGKVREDPAFYTASRCVDRGWIKFISDSEPLRSEYEITPEGHAALMTASQ